MADAPAPTPEDAQSKASATPAEAVESPASTSDPAPDVATPTETVETAETVETVAASDLKTPAEPSASSPSLASSIEVPASATPSPSTSPAQDSSAEGGEWDLLVQKLSHWLNSGDWQRQWQSARSPLTLAAALIGLLLVLRVYSAVLGVIESVPLLPGLLELAGVIAVVQFSLTKLVRSEDRREVIGGLQQRWRSFRGRG